ncbi:similar to Saccharomyces cerevisiae YDR195W REF2 RNA-binding protein involved in the cleavage step of mRNA 3'-end formation prior to polyadenylation, and in snoRNA maturation [Maudiozyma saulgeensis]|uniref:Similar to Saccharomyces cerevisiae YDR195W REF2 RNA-binding protein involved in the cleavage step of mRNA 3'-end formation prior to polyadenylation, and in snoRNA maturation n=1 Tax=Maudiozyma saulgeensis TaxID=1789683 RepID=A0A1X7R2I4_9SACH|nr:similar to Saccharomyces cerevisiae YDR195W REF2 RNA-binding protein involved in the cleavage step of mRNA 3'-end formation prior to polyadenylation, and in snoRNA maturation [Kazachstania saulgeensis]
MSANPVPQSVNVSHALPATIIQEMRNTLDNLEEKDIQLNGSQISLLSSYVAQLNQALITFKEDNKHVQPGNEGVTSGDLDLINGLTTLYKNYLDKFISIKERNNLTIDTVSSEAKSLNVNLDEGIRALKENKSSVIKQSSKTKATSSPKREIYIADSTKKNKTVDNTIAKDENIKEDQPNKKKISFTKYKKKDDSPVNSTDETLVNDKRSISNDDDDENNKSSSKKLKLDQNSTKIRSILKNGETKDVTTKSKKKVGISFPLEVDLVRVYGDDLPSTGLKVTPNELKKILRPFKEGEPKEKVLVEGFNSKPKLLNIQIVVKDSDITQLRNGPIKFDTRTPILYRDNFKNFSKDLKKPAREPIPEMGLQNDNTTPLVAQAYGRNSLLLRNDRGGIPYKRVPGVRRNKYPPRYQ